MARVATNAVERPNHMGIPVIATVFGEVEGLGNPEDYPEGVLVSAMVLGRLGSEWSGVAFAPATGPKDGVIRNEAGQIQAVEPVAERKSYNRNFMRGGSWPSYPHKHTNK